MRTSRVEAWAYLAQRASAMVLAPIVTIHLATVLVVIDGGLSTAEILARTQGRVGWMAFYLLFVVAAAMHGALGLRVVAREWLRCTPGLAASAAALYGIGVVVLGGLAVAALA